MDQQMQTWKRIWFGEGRWRYLWWVWRLALIAWIVLVVLVVLHH
jgi:hypothetical protein